MVTYKNTAGVCETRYLDDGQVAVFGVGAEVEDVPLHVHCG